MLDFSDWRQHRTIFASKSIFFTANDVTLPGLRFTKNKQLSRKYLLFHGLIFHKQNLYKTVNSKQLWFLWLYCNGTKLKHWLVCYQLLSVNLVLSSFVKRSTLWKFSPFVQKFNKLNWAFFIKLSVVCHLLNEFFFKWSVRVFLFKKKNNTLGILIDPEDFKISLSKYDPWNKFSIGKNSLKRIKRNSYLRKR